MNDTRNDQLSWADLGNCVGVDADYFFSVVGADTVVAKAICRGCPVRAECLEYAIESKFKHGVWGGMTPSQRRRLKPRRGPGLPAPGSPPVTDTCGPPQAVGVPRHLRLVAGNR